jgi:hypothetical protein
MRCIEFADIEEKFDPYCFLNGVGKGIVFRFGGRG